MSIFKKSKQAPAIEDVINARLMGEAKRNALYFVAFMRENGFSLEGFHTRNETWWNLDYRGEGIGCVKISDEFMFWLGHRCFDNSGGSVDDELKEFTWAHVVICPQETCKPPYCEGDNHSKNRWQVFGKEYESTCHAPMGFFNPDANDFENIKKLLLRLK